jgi:type II secretory pathway component GspD/PulD (secretin)
MNLFKTTYKVRAVKMKLITVVLWSGLLSGINAAALAQDTKTENAQSDSSKAYAPTYRLTYTLTEMDGAKRVGLQRFSMVVTPADRGTLKVGSKIPLVTGSYNSGSANTQTQFTYIDVGVNIEARIDSFTNGMRLTTKVERLSVADSASEHIIQPVEMIHEPIVRQAQIQNTALLQLGKSVMLGSLDTPGGTQHVDVEVLMEMVK